MAAGLAATALDRPGDLGLAAGAAARFARSRAADVGLVGLDPRGQRRALRPHHRLADLVQPGPGGLVAAEAHLPLEFHGRDPALARGHRVQWPEPLGQAGLGLLEDRAREQRVLLATGRALLDQPRLVRPGPVVAAAGAAEAVRPARPAQVGPALLIGAEPRQKARQIPRQIRRQHRAPPTHASSPPDYLNQPPYTQNLTVMDS